MKLLRDLVKEGMSDVASSLFRKAITEGIDSTNRYIKERTGLDININNPLEPAHTGKLKSLKEIKIENDHEIDDYKHLVKIHELEVNDRIDARKAYTKFIGRDEVKELFLPVLSIFIYVACFSGMILLVTIPDLDDTLIPTVATTLSVIVLTVANFWFGSSKASKELDRREV